MANSLSFVILSLICSEMVTCYRTTGGESGDISALEMHTIETVSDNRKDITHLTGAPNCDWATLLVQPSFIEPIGVCFVLQTPGLSYRTDYDQDTNSIVVKRFDNTNCEGDDFIVWLTLEADVINLNTGFLCEAYAMDTPTRTNDFVTGQISEDEPGDILTAGIPDRCELLFGNTYYKFSECNQDDQKIKERFYSDDKCENERTVGQYDLSGSDYSPDPALDKCSNIFPIAVDITAPMHDYLGVFYDGNAKPVNHKYGKIGEIVCTERQSYYVNDNKNSKVSCKQSGLLNNDDTCRCRENCSGDNCDPGKFDGKFCGDNAVCCCGDQCISTPLKRKNGQNRKSAASIIPIKVESIENIVDGAPFSKYTFYTLVIIGTINIAVVVWYLFVTKSKHKTHQQK